MRLTFGENCSEQPHPQEGIGDVRAHLNWCVRAALSSPCPSGLVAAGQFEPAAASRYRYAMARSEETTVADAPPGNWVDTIAPRVVRPYLRLARFDRPVGAWLLVWPCWWSIALAAHQVPAFRWAATGFGSRSEGFPDPILLLLFLVGAFAMRGLGCAFNDWVDRDLDRSVARTASRPMASGQIKTAGATVLMAVLAVPSLAVLLSFNRFAIGVGLASLVLIAAYPFAKRVTRFPQVVLGLAFAWGALLGWAAFTGELSYTPLILYAGSVAWVIGYDTIYASQDIEDDRIAGVGSAAIGFGRYVKVWLAVLYGIAAIAIGAAAWLAQVPVLPFAAVYIAAVVQLLWQIVDVRLADPADCLAKFRSNHTFGLLVFAAIVVANAFTKVVH